MTTESPRILLADDEDTFRSSTAKLLEQEGYHCDCAQDSYEAIRLLTSQHDLLLSDIRMPGNMQFEFLRDARTRFPRLPVVLVTGYPSVQTAVESIRLSFADYLLKPVDWPELRRAVDQVMKKAGFLRMTAAVREEACRVAASLDWLQEVMPELGSGKNERELTWPREKFLSQSFAQMATLSSQIRAVMASQQQGNVGESTDVCRTMDCPRLTAYREALESTVEVLEKTKFAFRSKDLGLLRKKIEQLLREDL
jgi:CheY-like chemotaxis protein